MTTCACGNCQFFDDKAPSAPAKNDAGLCRFNPPISQPARDDRGLWPVVEKEDWCGHFAATVERFMTPPAE
ncbi:hypothetical protein [Salinarimonas sp.]|uniref:hypothetical protein n=1 Tax=Salinarimonas sp. TaxID=2766526 RepID=UPI0032D908FE